MAPPDTNVDKQARRHKPALIGIAISLVAVGLLFVVYLFLVTDPDTEVENVDTVDETPAVSE